MGVIFVCNEQIVWSPSLTVGNVFFRQIKDLEGIINTESGFSMDLADEIEVDQQKFETFILSAIKHLERLQNTPLVTLLSGSIEVSLYLYFLIDKKWLSPPPKLQFLLIKAQVMNNPPFA